MQLKIGLIQAIPIYNLIRVLCLILIINSCSSIKISTMTELEINRSTKSIVLETKRKEILVCISDVAFHTSTGQLELTQSIEIIQDKLVQLKLTLCEEEEALKDDHSEKELEDQDQEVVEAKDV
ncbi:hypothetical protein [Microviridae sp.]|nr:hypothetical protein [Microviridae sp.]